MKSIRITLFVTAAIFISMVLGSLQVHAQVGMGECAKGSTELYIDIINYKNSVKANMQQAYVGERLKQDLSKMQSEHLSESEKVQSLEAGFMRCNFSAQDEEKISMDTEMFLKGVTPKNIED